MERDIDEQPLKIRSTRSAIRAGLKLFMGNFRRILRATWLPALFCAVVSAVYTKSFISVFSELLLTLGSEHAVAAQGLTQQYLSASGLTLLSVISSVVLLSYVFHILSRHRSEGVIPVPARFFTLPDSHALTRTVASAVVWFVVNLVVTLLCVLLFVEGASRQSMVLLGAGLAVVVVAAVLALPLVYPHLCYLTTPGTRLFPLLRSGYVAGLRHWGYMFSVLFVVALAMTVVLTVTSMPAIILVMAVMESQAGTLMGDPGGMPAYMGWLSLLVFTLEAFLQAYVVMAIHFPAYYMAGSIELQEQQRHETTTHTLH